MNDADKAAKSSAPQHDDGAASDVDHADSSVKPAPKTTSSPAPTAAKRSRFVSWWLSDLDDK